MSLVAALSARPDISAALQQASQKTGADFDYLLQTAMRESNLDCSAKSGTSSATGLFQFTEQSWLSTLKTYGAELGLGDEAAKIAQGADGKYCVANPADRSEILSLRKDPRVSALMAGAYTQESSNILQSRLGREPTGGELYIAHFLGAGGAAKLISTAEDDPSTQADRLFPAAAAANKSIFYEASGRPRTASEVYQQLISKHANAGTGGGAASMAAAIPDKVKGGTGVVASHANGEALPGGRIGTSSGQAGQYFPATMPGSGGLKLTPAVVQILSSLDPLPDGQKGDKGREQSRGLGAIGTWQDLARTSSRASDALA